MVVSTALTAYSITVKAFLCTLVVLLYDKVYLH